MARLDRRFAPGGSARASRYYAGERRKARGGTLNLHRTHVFRGVETIGIGTIVVIDSFPTAMLNGPITMATRIRITENSGVHEGLVFEFGSGTAGFVVWVESEQIGMRAGGGPSSGDEAAAVYDHGGELPVGWTMDIVACAHPGTGRAGLWANGKRLITATASNGNFGAGDGWSDTARGSFASDPSGTIATDVPAAFRQAPDGFDVIAPLSVYAGQLPAFF